MRQLSNNSSVEITPRDLQLFQKLNAAGWLTTRQIRDNFFPGKSTNAVCKRLRKLIAGKYIGMIRRSSTEYALYRLAGQGKLALIDHFNLDAEEINIPTQVPRKLEHLTKVNDLRFYFERLCGRLGVRQIFFFSERELGFYRQRSHKVSDVILHLLASHHIIPDALARLRISNQEAARDMDIAIEYDAGTEHASFFGRTKVKQYTMVSVRSRDWLEDFKVITLTSSIKRIVSLMQQAVYHQSPRHMFYFAPVEELSQEGWENAELFLDPHDFFVAIRQGNRIGVSEREIGDGIIPKYALTGLPAARPHVRTARERYYLEFHKLRRRLVEALYR